MAAYVSGIDIGHMAIRAVVLKKTAASWKIHEYGAVERFYGSSGEKTLNQEIAELSTRVQLRGPVYVTDSTMNVMARFIASVPLPPERLRRLVHLELEQHADENGDLAADMFILPIGGDEVICCCALAQPRQVRDLLAILRANAIKAEAVTIPAAAMYNVSRRAFSDKDERHSLLIDIGAEATRLILMRGDQFLGCRSLPMGGRQFTEALVQSQGRTFIDAEKIKISGHAAKSSAPEYSQPLGQDGDTKATDMPSFDDSDADDDSKLFDDDSNVFGDETSMQDAASEDLSFTAFDEEAVIIAGEAGADGADGAGGGELADNSRAVLEDDDIVVAKPGAQTRQIGADQLGDEMLQVAEQLHMQIRSSLKWFNAQIHISKLEIDDMYICGGASRLSGLRLYLEHRLGKPLAPLDPLAELDTEGVQDVAQYTRAVGAALQSEEAALKFDVRPETVLLKEAWKTEVIWPRIAAAMLLVAGIIYAVAMHIQQLNNLDAEKVYRQHEQDRQNQMAELNGLRADRDALFEDLRGITGRIYAGRDLLNAIRAFKDKAPKDLWIITMRTEGIVDEKGNKERGELQRSDTAIDRGSLYVSGRVMSQRNTDVSVYQEQFDKWYLDVFEWEDEEGNRLFKSREMISLSRLNEDVDRDMPYVFEVRFDFQPTSLADVTKSLGRKMKVPDAP